MKTRTAVLVALFSVGLSPMAMAQLGPDPAAPVETSPAASGMVDTADYVQVSALPYVFLSTEIDSPGAVGDSDASASTFSAVSPTLYFKAGWDRYVLRALVGSLTFPQLARVQGGFRLTDLLEIGPYIAGSRTMSEPEGGTTTTNSFFYFGPYARIAMGLGGAMSLETEIRLGLGMGSVVSDPPVGEKTTRDRSGFELAVSGALVINLTSNFDYTAALAIGYNTREDETAVGDVELAVTSVAVLPLGLRYRF